VNEPRVVTVVTGSRAEFGLLRPVMDAIAAHPRLDLRVVATGTHLLAPARTIDEVTARFDVAATIEMQRAGAVGRDADADALGRGVSGFAAHFAAERPDIVLVLGDRIEAFAAAAAAAVAGIHVAHLHGGDRAEGIADEALRHALTKLAHVHLPATASSAERLIAMGEDPRRTHLVGSPAVDGLDAIEPLSRDAYDALGAPEVILLLHPSGDDDGAERERATRLLDACRDAGRVLALDPNHDPGREGIVAALEDAGGVTRRAHLERRTFIGALRRTRMIVGNSSAGLIECAALPVRCVNVGSRQAGREKPAHVIDCPAWDAGALREAVSRAAREPVASFRHPYGDGRAGPRTADVLAGVDSDNHPLRKRNVY
jgi:UDP-hydrolysing UDP-N-acetyl-D-glucosamine 2-epimerase